MKISPRATALALTAAALLAISACGGSDSPTETEITTPKTKNAALSFTTLPATTLAKTVTTPMPAIGGATPPTTTAAKVTTTVAKAPTTSISKTVTTPLPKLPTRK